MVPCGLINRYVEQWPFSAIEAGKRVGEVRIKKMEYTKTCEIIHNPQISLSNLCYLPRIICIRIIDWENLLRDSPSQNIATEASKLSASKGAIGIGVIGHPYGLG